MSGLGQFVPIMIILVLMWFLIIKPQNDERAAHEALLASLSKDDHVVTTSGIHGFVVKVDGDTVVLEVAKSTQIVIDKQNVARRIEPDDGKK
ncbi:MAG: preprotein translocase subunit YajC [Alphaproteobacteria bacterium]|nr:preprotein translocase subunit YajC [Alphaproteobacteria bacterium]